MWQQSLGGGGKICADNSWPALFYRIDPKIGKESISVIESYHRSRADALHGHFQTKSISNRQQPDHACMNFCLSHSENSVQMHVLRRKSFLTEGAPLLAKF
eukprot:COSAG05_NODE_1414_length_4943_cov_9.634806_2_plen_101_part_00